MRFRVYLGERLELSSRKFKPCSRQSWESRITSYNVCYTKLLRSASAAGEILGKVKPGAGTADLSAAITTGMRLLADEGGRIIVISDFTNWNGDDPVASKNLAESYGLEVNFVKVGKPADNIGIINGWIEAMDGEYSYTGVVKNYKGESANVKIETGRGISGNASKSFTLSVPAGGTNQFSYNFV